MREFYLIITWDDIEPELRGPFPSDQARLDQAQSFRAAEGRDHGLFRLDITNGRPAVEAFGAQELLVDDETCDVEA
jgi:hypothetical protein